MWLKIKQEGQAAGFGPCFLTRASHFGIPGYLSHSHLEAPSSFGRRCARSRRRCRRCGRPSRCLSCTSHRSPRRALAVFSALSRFSQSNQKEDCPLQRLTSASRDEQKKAQASQYGSRSRGQREISGHGRRCRGEVILNIRVLFGGCSCWDVL